MAKIGHELQYPEREQAGKVLLVVDPAIKYQQRNRGDTPRVCPTCSSLTNRPVVHEYKTHHIPLDDAARCVVGDRILKQLEKLGYLDGKEMLGLYTQMGMIPPRVRFSYVKKIVDGPPVRLGIGLANRATVEGKDVGLWRKPIFVIQDHSAVTD